MKRLITLSTLALAIGLVGCANASPRWKDHQKNRHGFDDIARVIKVKPIYESVRVSVPEEHCWRERRYQSQYHGRESYTGPLVGAVVGGVVGNQFGAGSGKTAMTVAGTLLGASIANDIDKDGRAVDYRPAHQRRCETVERYESREEIVAYRVKYRYKGRVYRTRMDHDPGNTIRVHVTIRPID